VVRDSRRCSNEVGGERGEEVEATRRAGRTVLVRRGQRGQRAARRQVRARTCKIECWRGDNTRLRADRRCRELGLHIDDFRNRLIVISAARPRRAKAKVVMLNLARQ
jgi:hypothetical protein